MLTMFSSYRPTTVAASSKKVQNHTDFLGRSLDNIVGETGVGWDIFHFFSNIAENIYDRHFELTRQGSGILPLQPLLKSCVVTSFVATEYGVNDTWSNCPNLPRHGAVHGVRRDSVKCGRFTGS